MYRGFFFIQIFIYFVLSGVATANTQAPSSASASAKKILHYNPFRQWLSERHEKFSEQNPGFNINKLPGYRKKLAGLFSKQFDDLTIADDDPRKVQLGFLAKTKERLHALNDLLKSKEASMTLLKLRKLSSKCETSTFEETLDKINSIIDQAENMKHEDPRYEDFDAQLDNAFAWLLKHFDACLIK